MLICVHYCIDVVAVVVVEINSLAHDASFIAPRVNIITDKHRIIAMQTALSMASRVICHRYVMLVLSRRSNLGGHSTQPSVNRYTVLSRPSRAEHRGREGMFDIVRYE